MPSGKPSRFSIIDVVPAWPPGATASTTTVLRPSDDALTAAAKPAGPAPTIVRSYSDRDGAATMPRPVATCSTVADASRDPSGRIHNGRADGSTSAAPKTARTASGRPASTHSDRKSVV